MRDRLPVAPTVPGPILRHPDRYVWDFWYVHDEDEGVFHVFVLNAPLGADSTHEERNAVARIGHGVTQDFERIEWVEMDALTPRTDAWDDIGLWTGGTVRHQGGWLTAYTARNHRQPDVQAIGFATSMDLDLWERVDVPFLTTPPGFVAESDPAERTIHCWRDPYLHRAPSGEIEMVVAAKRADRPAGHRGTAAFLHGTPEAWEVVAAGPPSLDVAEFEVPSVLEDADGDRWLAFSSHDWADRVGGVGGLQVVSLEEDAPRQVIVPQAEGVYACQVVPELHGEVVGFDTDGGGLRRVGVRLPVRRPSGSILPAFPAPS